jgi:hypothetical protein
MDDKSVERERGGSVHVRERKKERKREREKKSGDRETFLTFYGNH